MNSNIFVDSSEHPETPPFGWSKYFPTKEFSRNDSDYQLVCTYLDFFQTIGRQNAKHSRNVDFKDLYEYFNSISRTTEQDSSVEKREVSGYGNPMEMFSNDPVNALKCLDLALFQHLYGSISTNNSELATINANLCNLHHYSSFRSLKSKSINKMVMVRGTVVRVGSIVPLVVSIEFYCKNCDMKFRKALIDGKYEPLDMCPKCSWKKMEVVRESAELRDTQMVKLQEVGEIVQGGVPRVIDCELGGDRCSTCVPGDIVDIVAIVKQLKVSGGRGFSKKPKSLYTAYLDAVSLVNVRKATHQGGSSASTGTATSESHFVNEESTSSSLAVSTDYLGISFGDKDFKFIKKLASEPNTLQLIVNSIAPEIYGHGIVKIAMALSLFGGVSKFSTRNDLLFRGDIHILVIGEPGMGKSQMLLAASQLSPRGIYVSGQTTSATGLTVTVVREANTGDFALEAGALVLADQGLCCIDEFDKMASHYGSLLEAMEQQSITVAKAGISCSIPARTSVIAAANPVGGHYMKDKPLLKNLKIPIAMLSRFDLVIVLLDKADEERDRMLSEYVIALHHKTGGNKSGFNRASAVAERDNELAEESFVSRMSNRIPIEKVIPPQLLKRYIGYAKRYCSPRLSEEAKGEIEKYYLHRRACDSQATPRLMEGIIRLCEAKCKAELREKITLDDAKDVVELMEEVINITSPDALAQKPKTRKRGKAKKLMDLVNDLKKQASENGDDVFTKSDIADTARKADVEFSLIDEIIDNLNLQGILLHKGNNMYRLQQV